MTAGGLRHSAAYMDPHGLINKQAKRAGRSQRRESLRFPHAVRLLDAELVGHRGDGGAPLLDQGEIPGSRVI